MKIHPTDQDGYDVPDRPPVKLDPRELELGFRFLGTLPKETVHQQAHVQVSGVSVSLGDESAADPKWRNCPTDPTYALRQLIDQDSEEVSAGGINRWNL